MIASQYCGYAKNFCLDYVKYIIHNLLFFNGAHESLRLLPIYLSASFNCNWNFAEDFRLKTEVYYQYIYNVPIDLSDTNGIKTSLNYRTRIDNSNLTNDGLGRNYGVELTLEKFFSNNCYSLFTSSLFQSKYSMPGFEERNTHFNSNFINNIVAGKEFEFGNNNQHVVGVNLRTTRRGGYRNVPYNLEESIKEDGPVYNYENSYEERLSDYYRIDLGLNYSYNKSDKVWKEGVNRHSEPYRSQKRKSSILR